MQKIKCFFLRCAAAGMSMLIIGTSHLSVQAAELNTPFPIAWQQSEDAGADIQRSNYLPEEKSWCNYPWNRGSETNNTIGLAGCSLLSVVNSVYYKTGQFINPTVLADYALEKSYRRPGVSGVALDFFPGFAQTYGNLYHATFVQGTTNAETVLSHVRTGGTACANVYGHWIAIVDYDAEANRYLILDSANTCKRVDNITWTDKENGIAWLTPEELLAEGKNGYYGIHNRYSALYAFDYTFTADTGDADGSGKTDLEDASACLAYYARNAVGAERNVLHPHPQQNAVCLAAADVNGDGEITSEDASCILQYYAQRVAGLTPEW